MCRLFDFTITFQFIKSGAVLAIPFQVHQTTARKSQKCLSLLINKFLSNLIGDSHES